MRRFIRGLQVLCAVLLLPVCGARAQEASSGVRQWMPEVVSAFPNVRDMAVSPDGNERYFTVESRRKEFSAIVVMRREDGRWSAPIVASFSGSYRDIEPAFSPDGSSLFFVSSRPLDGSSTMPKDYDIWHVTRKDAQSPWSEPVNVGGPVNTQKDEYYPSLTMWGDLYFTRESDDAARKEDIFVGRKDGRTYRLVEPLGEGVNSERYEFNAFIAPDESFLLFTSYGRKDDRGGGDLYISYRSNGVWSPARHLEGNINSERIDYSPFVDMRRDLLYFTSERSSLADHSDTPLSMETLLQIFRKEPLGAGRIFVVPFTADLNER